MQMHIQIKTYFKYHSTNVSRIEFSCKCLNPKEKTEKIKLVKLKLTEVHGTTKNEVCTDRLYCK